MDEAIIFLMRFFGWTLEYTTNLVNSLPLEKLEVLLVEARFLKAEEDYATARNFAMVLANWATANSTKRKTYRIEDFIGRPPRREGDQGPDLRKIAERQGIRVPEGGI